MIACVSLTVATNNSLIGKETTKMSIFDVIILKQKRRSATKVIWLIRMILEGSYLEQLRKVATNCSFRGKRISKISIFEAIILKQNEGVCQRNLYFCTDFGMFMPWTTTYFLEVSARVSSKIATNCSFRGKRTSKISFFDAVILN